MLKYIQALLPRWNEQKQRSQGKSAVGVWVITQMVKCPYCSKSFDIIQANLRRKTNQGTIKITQKQVTRYDKDKFDYNEVTTEIPTPPYFGALMESTENLDEHINCIHCEGTIHIPETSWKFGE